MQVKWHLLATAAMCGEQVHQPVMDAVSAKARIPGTVSVCIA